MPTNQMASVVFNFTTPVGEEAAVVRHIRDTSGGFAFSELDAVGQAIEDWWNNDDGPISKARSSFNNGLTLVNVTLTTLAGAPPLQVVHDVGTAGLSLEDAPVPEAALVNTWYTGSPGRSFRGRSFWPGYAQDIIGDNGLVLSSALAVLNDQFLRLLDDVNAVVPGAIEWCVYSKTLDVMTPITSIAVRNVIHHQSKRNP